MAYTLFIERESGEISLKEWISAVNSVDGIKIDDSDNEICNPQTNEKILIPGNKGDVAVLFRSKSLFGFGKKSEWVKCIYFQKGRASFNLPENIDNENDRLRTVVSQIAKLLKAKIVGDNGEIYNW